MLLFSTHQWPNCKINYCRSNIRRRFLAEKSFTEIQRRQEHLCLRSKGENDPHSSTQVKMWLNINMNRPKGRTILLFALLRFYISETLGSVKGDFLLIPISYMSLCSMPTCSLSPVHFFSCWHPRVDSATVRSSHCLIPPEPVSASCFHAEDESRVL